MCINMLQNVSTCLLAFQHVSQYVNLFQNVLKGQNASHYFKTFWTFQYVSKGFNMLHNIWYSFNISKIVSICFKRFQHALNNSKCFKVFQHASTCLQIFQYISACFTLSLKVAHCLTIFQTLLKQRFNMFQTCCIEDHLGTFWTILKRPGR